MDGSKSPEVAKQINSLSDKILELCAEIETLGQLKAEAQSEYDGALQVTLIRLDHKDPITDKVGNKIIGCPATTAKDIAKGLIVEDRFKVDIAEINYKACISKIECCKAVLNAKQSIFRHLSET